MFDRYDAVFALAKEVSQAASARLDLRVNIDEARFKEAFIAAEYTCAFHGTGEPNHIKKASHLCFWLLRTKPFSMSPRLRKRLADVTGISEIVDQFDSDYVARFKVALETPINEMLALILTDDLIKKGYADIETKLNKTKKPGRIKSDSDIMKERMNYNAAKVGRSFKDIMNSFREHNYSARGLAIMLGVVYSTGYESLQPE